MVNGSLRDQSEIGQTPLRCFAAPAGAGGDGETAFRRDLQSRGIHMTIKRAAVIGAGLMGSGIAQVAAASGYSVTLVEVSDDLVARGVKSIEQTLSRLVDKAAIKPADRDATLARLQGTTSLEDLSDVDIAIEAIVENLEAKHDLFTRLHSICKPVAIFATNTSSLSVTEIMRAVPVERQRRFVGLHFFNPVPIM